MTRNSWSLITLKTVSVATLIHGVGDDGFISPPPPAGEVVSSQLGSAPNPSLQLPTNLLANSQRKKYSEKKHVTTSVGQGCHLTWVVDSYGQHSKPVLSTFRDNNFSGPSGLVCMVIMHLPAGEATLLQLCTCELIWVVY